MMPDASSPKSRQLGPYILLDRLAVGGMAEIYRANERRPAGEPRILVVKQMLSSLASDPSMRELFAEEARIGSLVRHANIVQVLGQGEEQGLPYLALEYVPGVDLRQLQRFATLTQEAIGVQRAVYVGRELLAGLTALHEARDEYGAALQICHRDVSPSNLLLSIHGDVKLGDFGIARAALRERPSPGAMGERTRGKLGYLAPEEVRGDAIDARADVFSAAVVIAEMLIGQPLFHGGSELAVLLAIRDANTERLSAAAASFPSGLQSVLLKALARDPEDRFPSAKAFSTALEPFVSNGHEPQREELGELIHAARAYYNSARQHPSPGPRQSGAVVRDFSDEGGVPTAEIPALTYQVRQADGRLLGAQPYAVVVESVATGRLSVHDEISLGDSPFRPLGEWSELARHLPSLRQTPTGKQKRVQPEGLDQVNLAAGGIISALGRAAMEHHTGLWLCELGEVRKEIYVEDGVPQFVSSNLAGELLGEHLVAHQVISRAELDMALALMPRFEGRLGDTLIAMELIEPVQLFQHIARQVRERVLDLFTWTAGTASFHEGASPNTNGFPLGLDVWEILDEGIGRRLEAGIEQELETHHDSHLARVDAMPPELFTTDLPDSLNQVIAMLESPKTLRAINDALKSPDDVDRGKRAVILLLHLQGIRWSAAE